MVRPKQRKARQRREWTQGHLLQLSCGHDLFGDGFGGPVKRALPDQLRDWITPAVDDDMRRCWNCHADEVMRDHTNLKPCSRPFAWWRYSASEPRDACREEAEQLHGLGLLSDDEINARRVLDADTEEKEEQYPMHRVNRIYRRRFSWWHCVAQQPRDYELCEVAQIVAVKGQNEIEQRLLDDPAQALKDIRYLKKDKLPSDILRHLEEDELRLLGLDCLVLD
jgi:hypothetical protein